MQRLWLIPRPVAPSLSTVNEALGVVSRSLGDWSFAREKFSRAVGFVRARTLFRRCELGERVCATGEVRVVADGTIRIDSRVTFFGGMVPTELVAHRGGRIDIGQSTGLNYGVSIEAFEHISIGSRCLFASMIRLCDRAGTVTKPIVIEDNVWVAHGVIVEPGVRVGEGAVLSAGAVVTKDVPAGHIAIGNPARTMPIATVARAEG